MKKKELEERITNITAARFIEEITNIIKEKGLEGIETELIKNEDGTYKGIVEIYFNIEYSKEDIDIISKFKKTE